MIQCSVIYDHHGRIGKDGLGAVEVRITIDRKIYYISTGVRVLMENFVGGTVVNQADAPELNERISIMFRRIQEEVNRYVSEGMAPDVKAIRSRVWTLRNEAENGTSLLVDYIESLEGELQLRPGTLKHYKTLRYRLAEFGQIRRWQDLTLDNIIAFDVWLHKQKCPQSEGERKAGVPARNLGDGAVYNYHKCLKAVISRAVITGKVSVNPYDRLRGQFRRGERESVDYLTEDEMRAVESIHPLEGSQMAVARDLFVVQMYTGLGYSDMQSFDFGAYRLVDGVWRNTGERLKTGVPYVSQLLPPVVEILEKYRFSIPKMGNADYNHCLKAIGMAAGITRPLHSHMARHTFATWMLANGVSIEHVSRMLGHTNIVQTQRYAKVLAQSIHEDYTRIAQKWNQFTK